MIRNNPYISRGRDYNQVFRFYALNNGSERMRQQLIAVLNGERLTMDPDCLIEISRLGREFDEGRIE